MPKKYSLHEVDNILKAKVDREFLGELMVHNEDLIWFTVNKYVGNPDYLAEINGMEKCDIFQVACIGFINAIDNFDCERGTLFTTYAPAVIAGEVKGFLRDKGRLLKLTRSAYELNAKIYKHTEDIYYDRFISFEDVAKNIGADVSEVEKVMTIGSKPLSFKHKVQLNETFSSDLEAYLIYECGQSMEDKVLDNMYLEQLLSQIEMQLSERGKRILHAKLKGITHEQIAKQENISKITVTRTMNEIRRIVRDVLNI